MQRSEPPRRRARVLTKQPETPTRHVLGLSGGKDSAALAIYMRDQVPEMEYFFCDTGRELPETYEFLQRLELVLGKKIARLNSDRDFDHWLHVFGGALPSAQMRWCTKNLKIKPFEAWIGSDSAITYIGIRADEDREGYISSRTNLIPKFPFKEDGLVKEDILRILDEAGVGLPKYYEWRTRSGCFFCFFQRKHEWVRLSEEHPDLFQKAVEYEQKVNYEDKAMKGRQFTWSQGESLLELLERKEEIKADHDLALKREQTRRPNRPLSEALAEVLEGEDDTKPCLMCHI
jgi:3'-phosphoadenosine 5'-phosphosulfate sulfotransferase (PAPS reductase)/FAD synthetase